MGTDQRSLSKPFWRGVGVRLAEKTTPLEGLAGGGVGNLFRKKTNPTRLVHPLKGVGGYDAIGFPPWISVIDHTEL